MHPIKVRWFYILIGVELLAFNEIGVDADIYTYHEQNTNKYKQIIVI